MNIDDYQEAVEKIKDEYVQRILAILRTIGNAAVDRGWLWDGDIRDMSCDDYRWSVDVSLDDRGVYNVGFTFVIEESLQHDGETTGINFSLKMEQWSTGQNDWSNKTLYHREPFNHTRDVWVDVLDKNAIEKRFKLIEKESPDHIANLLPKQRPFRRFRANLVQKVIAPHGRCAGQRICVEHAQRKSVKSCKTRAFRRKIAEATEVQIICKSGLTGWQCRLRDNYDNNYEQFESYCETHNIAHRLGFDDAEAAWAANPIIQGSTDPSDLCVVKEAIPKRKLRKSSRKK